MTSLSAEIAGRSFETARRGYDTDQVDEFLADIADQVSELEDDLRASAVRIAGLQRRVDAPKEATQQIEAAYLAAAEAKQKLLEEAERKAEKIIAAAEKKAASIVSDPSEAAADARRKAEDVLIQAKTRLEEAAAEADRIKTAAAEEAERMMADARRDAVAAVAAAEQEARARLTETEERYRALAIRLRNLQAAIASMLESAAGESDEIRVILDDGSLQAKRPPTLATGT